MTMPTPDRERLRRLADAATPGPWVATKCEPCAKRGREDIQIWDERGYIPIAQWMDEVDPDAGEDAEFIAAARTAVPQLLDALDAAEARLQTIRDLHHPWGDVLTRTYICDSCDDAYPCPTVRALEG